MSLLTATQDDLGTGRGKPLPNRAYRGTIETAAEVPAGPGMQLKQRIGNIRTYSKAVDEDSQGALTLPDGSTYNIGRRKVFSKFWTTHPTPKAQKVGNAYLSRQAMSAGLMPVPSTGQSAELNFDSWQDYGQASIGQDVIFTSKQVRRENGSGQPALDPETQEPIIDVEVADYIVVRDDPGAGISF